MCGIIGYVGRNNAVPYLIEGLEKLEYRGYDSSGIALQKANEIFLLKRKGKIAELRKAVSPELFSFLLLFFSYFFEYSELFLLFIGTSPV